MRHKAVPLFTKASDTDEDIADTWVFTAQACCSIAFQTEMLQDRRATSL